MIHSQYNVKDKLLLDMFFITQCLISIYIINRLAIFNHGISFEKKNGNVVTRTSVAVSQSTAWLSNRPSYFLPKKLIGNVGN